jgi:hypothetical protein
LRTINMEAGKAHEQAPAKRDMSTDDLLAFSRDTYQALKKKHGAKALKATDWKIVGLWLWVSGDTKPIKSGLKEAGFRWSPNKEKWYFAGRPSISRKHHSYEEIVEMHGETKLGIR